MVLLARRLSSLGQPHALQQCSHIAKCAFHQPSRSHQQRYGVLSAVAVAATDVVSSDADNVPSTSYSSSTPEVQQQLPEMQLQLPPPSKTQVRTAVFIKSSRLLADCPPARHPEVAVIGRSNVGKSSLINMLTNRKSLAMVSKQPGKTRCINHFLINDNWYLVDLPGYGYARTGKDDRKEFDQFTKAYFLQRSTLTMVLLLVDSSIPPQTVDLEYAAWLGKKGVPFSMVFTKMDKKKKGLPKKDENITAFKHALLQHYGFTAVPPSLITSSASGAGKQELLSFIASLRVLFEQQ
eukprot:GHRR01008026.1.p1 GENE.GHRR01008026.1~~GHRR01008026.1.p1  ORF type:complete len:294 (+),score=74.87 GHRR01008026.1:358-1239(+)